MKKVALILAFVLGFVLIQSVFIISETERAVKLRFGKVVNFDIKPGLHFAIPVIEKIRRFDARVLTMDSRPSEYLTAEKKALVVDSYVKWRVKDVQKFYVATNGDIVRAASLLASRVDNGLRNQFGERTLTEAVSGERDELMRELALTLDKVVERELGIEVLDVRIKKINLPDSISSKVFERMATERERLARELRSQGKEVAEGIRADADRQKVVIESAAYRDAQKIRGEGDAKATTIYAKAFTADTGFYDFYRSITAYQETFNSKNDVLILSPDSAFFKFLKDKTGE